MPSPHSLSAAAVAASLALLAACSSMEPSRTSGIPEKLNPPGDQALVLETQATGFQVYECGPAAADASKFQWNFKAPEADLFDGTGKKIGKHYAGPTWEGNDGSKVVGTVQVQDPGPDANAISWLLLSSKSNLGSGSFGLVKSIQRVKTSGGKAPADGCGAAQVGQQAKVPYKAVYNFYAARS
jgi:hypothetical protein